MLPDVKLAFEIVDGYFACDEPSAITDAWEILKTAILSQQTNNNAITPPDKRDCDTCQLDGECYVTMLQCKGYRRAAQ